MAKSKAPARKPKARPRLDYCIVCGERKMIRKLVAKQRRGGRGPIEVVADVCGNCGEKYFGS